MMALLDAGAAFGAIPMPRLGAEPPTDYLAFKWGANPTTKGTLYLTKEGAKQVMDDYRSRGVIQYIDLWHATWDPNARPEDKKAVGQYRLDLDDKGLWYRAIQFGPKTAQEIRDGNWLYFSPAVMHDKNGVITQNKNAALVNYPGTVNAVPTILSDSPPKGTPMSMDDKGRKAVSARATLESALRQYQALADTDGTAKDHGNDMAARIASALEASEGYMRSSGCMDAVMMASKKLDASERMMAALSADFKESDPDRLHGLVMAQLDGIAQPTPIAEGSVVLSKEEAAQYSKLLLAGHADRIPTTKRSAVAALPLTGQLAYLSAAQPLTSGMSAPREAAPISPTSDNTRAALDAAPKAGKKPTTLADCSPEQLVKVESYLDLARRFQGTAFNEAIETQQALTLLSGEAAAGDQIRWSPLQGESPNHLATLTGSN